MIESEEKSLINEIGKEQIIKWCSFLPRKELILLLRKIFSENENRVKILYTSKINKRINPKSNFFDYLFNRGVTDIIIEIISENSDPSTEQKIKELFLEYKYGSKPSFYFLTLE